MLPAIFNNQPIRQIEQNGKLWISLTDCAKACNKEHKQLARVFESDSLKELIQEEVIGQNVLSQSSEANYIQIDENTSAIKDSQAILSDLIIANKTDKELGKGTWLDITEELGQAVLIEIAQQLLPAFRRWCNKHIRQMLKQGYTISESATLAQLDLAQEQIAELKQTKSLLSRKLRNREAQLLNLAPKLEAVKSAKYNIVDEQDLNDAMHLLWSRCGMAYFCEHPVKTSQGLARFDSVSKTNRYVTIAEFKIGWVNYAVADKTLFCKKQYLAKISEHFAGKIIKFTFISPLIDEASIEDFIAQKAEQIPANINVTHCKLDERYFRSLKQRFLRLAVANGLGLQEALAEWQNSGCEQIVQTILELKQA